MKNVNAIHEQVTTNREQWNQYRRTLKANLSTLEAIYDAQYDVESPLYNSTPAQTVAAFVETVGYEAAVEIVASLVNRSAWDGRISARCAEWANTQENSWDEEACSRLSIYTNRIHTAHLNQIADAMMKYEPTTEPAVEEVQEAAEEAQEAAEEVQEAVEEAQQESILDKVVAELEAQKDRSAWNKGVKEYAFELLESLKERAALEGRNPESRKEAYKWMLNGADNWRDYSYGGCSLIYDRNIAERLCSPSELKKTKYGHLNPNKMESWLDVQARALYQACKLVLRAFPYESEVK